VFLNIPGPKNLKVSKNSDGGRHRISDNAELTRIAVIMVHPYAEVRLAWVERFGVPDLEESRRTVKAARTPGPLGLLR
jgi:hypothetical protein